MSYSEMNAPRQIDETIFAHTALTRIFPDTCSNCRRCRSTVLFVFVGNIAFRTLPFAESLGQRNAATVAKPMHTMVEHQIHMYPTHYCVINPQSTQTPRDLILAQFESLPSTWGRPFDRHEPRGHESIIRSQSVRIGLEINVRTGERHQYLARRAF